MENKFDELKNKEREISLFISRLPMETKRDFKYLAEAQFCGDYGLCLKYIFDEALTYQSMKALFFDKLQNMENKLDKLIEIKEEKIEENNKPLHKRLGSRIEVKKEGK